MAVVLNASGVNRVRFTVINNMKSLFHPRTGALVKYLAIISTSMI